MEKCLGGINILFELFFTVDTVDAFEAVDEVDTVDIVDKLSKLCFERKFFLFEHCLRRQNDS